MSLFFSLWCTHELISLAGHRGSGREKESRRETRHSTWKPGDGRFSFLGEISSGPAPSLSLRCAASTGGTSSKGLPTNYMKDRRGPIIWDRVPPYRGRIRSFESLHIQLVGEKHYSTSHLRGQGLSARKAARFPRGGICAGGAAGRKMVTAADRPKAIE